MPADLRRRVKVCGRVQSSVSIPQERPMKSRMAVLTLAGMALAVVFACRLTADEPVRPADGGQQAGPTADEALQLLKDGNARFVADMPKEAERGSKKRIELAQGQRPIAV